MEIEYRVRRPAKGEVDIGVEEGATVVVEDSHMVALTCQEVVVDMGASLEEGLAVHMVSCDADVTALVGKHTSPMSCCAACSRYARSIACRVVAFCMEAPDLLVVRTLQ